MKKVFTAILSFTLAVLCVLSISSCSKPPEYSEVEARFIELVEASYAINDLLFGEGLPTDKRIYDPWQDMKTYERKGEDGEVLIGSNDKPLLGYYCFFEDEEYGDLLAYRDGATAETVYLKVEKAELADMEAVFVNEQKTRYYYPCDYTPPEKIRYYTDSDPTNYDYVSLESEYISIEEMKAAAEKVYSAEYLKSIYESMFTGVAADEEGKLSGLSARYIEYMDANSIGSKSVLMESNEYEPLIKEKRIYDFSTAKVVKPGSKELVNIEVDTHLESTPEVIESVRITMVLVDGVWYLDSPTY